MTESFQTKPTFPIAGIRPGDQQTIKMRFLLLLLALSAGCQTYQSGPDITVAQLDSIKPGVTTRVEIHTMFGDPTSISKHQGFRVPYENWDYRKRGVMSFYFTNAVLDHFSVSAYQPSPY